MPTKRAAGAYSSASLSLVSESSTRGGIGGKRGDGSWSVARTLRSPIDVVDVGASKMGLMGGDVRSAVACVGLEGGSGSGGGSGDVDNVQGTEKVAL